ncbi:hypothetical protein RB195_002169 [Necator americanus]|uniref:DNA topoisomerase (ATP-hydrolyzing) n=1 Tax=Necator americanus TaxID=51031 RepID=A0ABR1DIR8_NECAM
MAFSAFGAALISSSESSDYHEVVFEFRKQPEIKRSQISAVDSAMSVSSSSLKEEDLTCKQKSILRKIEFICLDLVKQLSSTSHPNKIILRASEDDAHKQIVIFPRQGMRLAFIMQSLARIYQLITNGQQSTKRDLYYDNKKLYKNQGNFDRSISTICDLLDEPRVVLNIISSSKGIISGALAFLTKDKQLIDCRNQQVLISEYLMDHRVVSEAQFIIVVEKHAMFEKMIDEGFFECFPKSGKGYPDICTRQLLRWLVGQLAVPVYGLFDSDPHGIEIMLTFKYGSISERREGQGCCIKQMQWLGFKPSDIRSLPIVSQHFLKLRNRDFVKISKIRRRALGLDEFVVAKELDILRSLRSKLELEALSMIAPQFIIRVYLLPRLVRLLQSFSRTVQHPALETEGKA